MLKLIHRAGLKSWPKPFQNLRAICETDLMQHHSIHVVTAWIGNTPTVTLGHYLQTLDSDFEKAVRGGAESGARAVQNALPSPAVTDRRERTKSTQEASTKAVPSVLDVWRRLVSAPDVAIKYTQKYSNLQPSVP